MAKLVLGLIGAIGSGKDTAALYLKDTHKFFSTSFGDTVRE
jgi:dephospho-CoA kinase